MRLKLDENVSIVAKDLLTQSAMTSTPSPTNSSLADPIPTCWLPPSPKGELVSNTRWSADDQA